MGGINSITRQGVRVLKLVSGYPIPSKNIIQLTPTSTSSNYWAFGNGVKIGDSIFYAMKRGPSHIGGTNISGMFHNLVTGLWSSPIQIAVTGDTDIFSGVAMGRIGSSLYCFVSKYNVAGDSFTASGYVKSTDLTATSWGSYTSITAPPYERFESYGKFQESVTTPGKFFTTRFSHLDGGSDPYAIEVIKIESDGATWTPILVHDSLTKYSEMSLCNVGGSVWIGLARVFETNGVFGLFHSTDDCETWALVGNTDLGAGPGNGDLIYVGSQIHFIFQNRATGFLQVSKNNELADVLNLDFNSPANYWENGPGDSLDGLGYAWWDLMRDTDTVYITACRELSSSTAHVYGTLDKISSI